MSKKCYVLCSSVIGYNDEEYYFEDGHEVNKVFSDPFKANEAIVTLTTNVLFGKEADFNIKQSLIIFLGQLYASTSNIIDMIDKINAEISATNIKKSSTVLQDEDYFMENEDYFMENGFCDFFDMKKMTEESKAKFVEFFIETLEYSPYYIQEIDYE